MLRCSPSEVAMSLHERDAVPVRSPYGLLYLLDPRDPNVLPLHGWERMTDYQLCFWYALEMERRQLRYAAIAERLGFVTVEVHQADLGKPEVFARMREALQIPVDGGAEAGVSAMGKPAALARTNELDAQEAQVWKAVLPYEPLLPAILDEKYPVRPQTAAA
jgi:hypothetical protein